ncbi:MAG: hypothetical protein FWD83_01500 [Promicromonosporaceae bacterium]|nr:hypothetical protein [Promicromonosporaceae bacterium]
MTLTDLATRTGVNIATTHREVQRLVTAAVLVERRVGQARLVSANTTHPLFTNMQAIVNQTYGPEPVLRDLFDGTPGVQQAFIYGSWADRRRGVQGPPPQDIDVLAVGELDLPTMLSIRQEAGRRLRREVNIHRVAAEAWANPGEDSFLTTVQSRPLIPLGKEA